MNVQALDSNTPLLPVHRLKAHSRVEKELSDRSSLFFSEEIFAALHSDAALSGTFTFKETRQFEDSISWWLKTIEQLEKQPSKELGILAIQDPILSQSLKNDLEQMKEALAHLQSGNTQELKKLISKELKRTNRFLLPIPFVDKQTNLLHVIGCVFENDHQGLTRIRLIDKGIGAENHHPVLKIDAGKVKRSYSNLPMRLRDTDLLSPHNALGNTLFKKLSALARNEDNKSPASPFLIYGVFREVIGEVYPEDVRVEGKGANDRTENKELWYTPEMAVTSSRSETSIHQLIRLSSRDQITQKVISSDINSFKKLNLSIKIQSWLDLASELEKNPNKEISVQRIERCLAESNFSIGKAFKNKWLTEEEFLFWRELSDKITLLLNQRVKTAPNSLIHTPSIKIDIESQKIKGKISPALKKQIPHRPLEKPLKFFKPPLLTSENIADILVDCLNFTERECEPSLRFRVMNSFFSTLPLDHSFWKNVPAEKIEQTLTLIKQCLQSTAASLDTPQREKELFPELRLLAATGMRISDQLARQIHGPNFLHLDSYAIDIPDLGDTFFFQNHVSAERWKEIMQYFQEQSEQKPQKFLISNFICSPLQWNELVKCKSNENPEQMIRYHRQFGNPITEPQELGSEYRTIKTHGNRIVSNTTLSRDLPYPKTYSDIYYFHIVISRLFYNGSMEWRNNELKNFISCDKKPIVTLREDINTGDRSYSINYANIAGENEGSQKESHKVFMRRLPLSSQVEDAFHPEENENQLVVNTTEELFPNSEVYLSDLKKIAREPSFQLSMLMQWCKSHPTALEKVEIHHFIEYLVLRNQSPIEELNQHPFLKEELFAFLDNQIERYSAKLSSLSSRLFWVRLSLNLKARLGDDQLDQWIDKNIAALNDVYILLEQQSSDDNEKKKNAQIYSLLSHLAYFATHYRDLTAERAEVFAGWHLLRFLYRVEESQLPYWINVDIDQFLIDRGELLFSKLAQMTHLPHPFTLSNHSAFEDFKQHCPAVERISQEVFRFDNHHQELEFDLLKKSITFNGKEISFAPVRLRGNHDTKARALLANKERQLSAERLLSLFLQKQVIVTQIRVITEGELFTFRTSEGQIFLFDRKKKTLGPDKKYWENLGHLHPIGELKLTKKEDNLWSLYSDDSYSIPSLIKTNDITYELPHGKERFIVTPKQLDFEESFTLQNDQGWYRKSSLPPILPALFHEGEFYQRSVDSSSKLPEYLLLLFKHPFAEIEPLDDQNIRIWRLNESGKRTGEWFINPSHNPQIPFLENLGSKDRLIFWTDGEKIRAECREMDLSFHYDGKNWLCDTDPLIGWVAKESSQGFRGVILTNGKEERLLLPCKALEESDWLDNKGTLVPKPIGGLRVPEPFVVFEKDLISENWIGTTNTAHLYLTYLLISQGNEEGARLALGALNFDKSWTAQDWDIINLIAKNSNSTPEATSLKMKLALIVLENANRPRFNEPVSLNGSPQSEFWTTIAKEIGRFLDLQGSTSVHIPLRFQLKEEQISKIITAIRQFERNDGGPSPTLPLDTFNTSSHHFFDAEPIKVVNGWYQVDKNQKAWIQPKHFWDFLFISLVDEHDLRHVPDADRNSVRFDESPINVKFWHNALRTLDKDALRSGGYVGSLGPIPDPSTKEYSPDQITYSFRDIQNRFWPLLTQLYHSGNTWTSPDSSKVVDIDIELCLMYQSLVEEALQNPQKALEEGSVWSRSGALLFLLWSARRYQGEFVAFVKSQSKDPTNWNPITITDFFNHLKYSKRIFKGDDKTGKLNLINLNKSKEKIASKTLKPEIISWNPAKEPSLAPFLHQQENIPFLPFKPQEALLNDFFDMETKPIYDRKTFVLADRAQDETVTLGVKKQIAQLGKAFSDTESEKPSLANHTFQRFYLKSGKTEIELSQAIKDTVQHYDEKLESLTKSILSCANYPTKAEMETLSREKQIEAEIRNQKLSSGEIKPLDLLDIFLQFDPKHPELLKRENPCLDEAKINELHQLCLDYFQGETFKAQLLEALSCLNNTPTGKEKCAEVLVKEQTFDRNNWSLWLYQAMMGKLLRSDPDQAKLVLDIEKEIFKDNLAPEKLRQYFFEVQAGGGKTKLIAVLLATMIHLHGKSPVFTSLPQLFDITKEDFSTSLLSYIRKRIQPISLSLNQNPSLKELCKIRDALKNPPEIYIGSIVTPETQYAIWLEYVTALLFKDTNRVSVLNDILCFFENNVVNLIDEMHQNGSSLLEANITLGKGQPLDDYALDFFHEAFKFLVKDPTLGLMERKETRLSEQDFKNLKKSLASHFAQKILPSELVSEDLLAYLLDMEKAPPTFLLDWNNSRDSALKIQAKQMGILRGLITEILPHVFTQVEDINHGPSVDPDNEVAAPLNRREKTAAKFENPEIGLCLTITGFLQRGLTDIDQIKRLVTALQEKMQEEKDSLPQNEILTPTEKDFLKWQEGSQFKISLADLNLNSTSTKIWEQMLENLSHRQEAIFAYLDLKPMREVMLYPYKAAASAARLVYGSWANICFSATLGPREKYPFFGEEQNYKNDPQFLVKVIERITTTSNDHFVWYEDESIPAFLAQLPQDLLKTGRIAGIINYGGTAPGKSSKVWADEACAYFSEHEIPFDGVVYVHQEKLNSEKVLYLLTKDNPNPIRLKGSELKTELKRLGKDHLKLFKMYGPDDTTGLDLAIESDKIMAISLGESPSIDEWAQAYLRMRQVLKPMEDPSQGQWAIWCLPKSIAPKIRNMRSQKESEAIDAKDCLLWALENYQEKLKAEITAAAFQNIEELFIQIARMQLRSKSPQNQVDSFHKSFKNGMIKNTDYDPFGIHGFAKTNIDTSVVLKDFEKSCSTKYGIDLNQYEWAVKRRDLIIERTREAVSEMKDQKITLNAQTHQRQRTQQQTRTRQQNRAQNVTYQMKHRNNIAARSEGDYVNNQLSLNQPNLLSHSSFIRSASEYFETPRIPKNLYLTVDSILAGRTEPSKEWEKENLKEFNHLLLIQDGQSEPIYIGISQENGKNYLEQMQGNQILAERKVALLGRDGVVIANGQGEHGFEEESLRQLKENEEFKVLTVWIDILCGQPFESETLKKLLKEDQHDVTALFNLILNLQVRPSANAKKRYDYLIKKISPSPSMKYSISPQQSDSLERKNSTSEKLPSAILPQFPKAEPWKFTKKEYQPQPNLNLGKEHLSSTHKKPKAKIEEIERPKVIEESPAPAIQIPSIIPEHVITSPQNSLKTPEENVKELTAANSKKINSLPDELLEHLTPEALKALDIKRHQKLSDKQLNILYPKPPLLTRLGRGLGLLAIMVPRILFQFAINLIVLAGVGLVRLFTFRNNQNSNRLRNTFVKLSKETFINAPTRALAVLWLPFSYLKFKRLQLKF